MKDDCWEMGALSGHLDSQAVLDVVRSSLPGNAATRKTEKYWRWKHIENPFGMSLGTIANVQEEVIAVRSFMQWRFLFGTTELTAVRAVDTVTADAWRGKGIFKQLTLQAVKNLEADGVDLVFNTPNQNSAPGYLKMGWCDIGSVPLYIRPLEPSRIVWALIKGKSGAGPVMPAWYPDEAQLPRWVEWEDHGEIIAVMRSHEMNRRPFGLRTVRTADYLSWRYGRNPQADYRVHILRENGHAVAVAVLRPNIRYGLRELVITEIWARDANPGFMRRLLDTLGRCAEADYMIAHFAKGSAEYTALRKSSFFRVPVRKMRLFTRKLGKPLPASVFTMQGWDLTLGDLELF
ncbi:GNAT family N-acetyltransferase [Nitrosomonas sp. ANs5]|uniref:GNAT family N-acetyltransferase n=1 Tax=Nitrosomonas sp. ANs5 TaxID=3423941 RepID=UPI003D32F5B2